jgi:hypothetical protein
VRLRHRLIGLGGAALLAALPRPVAAQERTLDFQSFHSDIVVRRNGSLIVTETIRVRFIGSWNGIYRKIPVEYDAGHGENYTLFLDMEEIRDEASGPLHFETQRSHGDRVFKIFVPSASDATRTIVLRYTVANGLRFLEGHDELYWNVTGDESDYPIQRASARVLLPPEATGIRTTAYAGPPGSVERSVDISTAANGIDFATRAPLGFHEGLTIVAGWDPGAVARPTAAERIRRVLLSNLPLAAPFIAFAAMFLVWRRVGRDPRLRPIAPRYQPPDGMTPAEAGTIIDDKADMRDVTATIVDLAVRGYLRIEETDAKRAAERTFTFHSLRTAAEWQTLKAHERKLMDALFDEGRRTATETDDLENTFFVDLPAIRSELNATLVDGGHFRRHPNHVRAIWIGIGVAVGAIVGIGGIALAAALGQQPGAALVGGFATVAVMVGFAYFMPARTIAGTRALEELKGFEEFLRRVEEDRFERLSPTPELFERYLPYAMAFGVEKQWANAFTGIYTAPPTWYAAWGSPAIFDARMFTSDMSSMATRTQAAMVSAPRSESGSSGFSGGGSSGGGGFSGGGFGGGGVGGF